MVAQGMAVLRGCRMCPPRRRRSPRAAWGSSPLPSAISRLTPWRTAAARSPVLSQRVVSFALGDESPAMDRLRREHHPGHPAPGRHRDGFVRWTPGGRRHRPCGPRPFGAWCRLVRPRRRAASIMTRRLRRRGEPAAGKLTSGPCFAIFAPPRDPLNHLIMILDHQGVGTACTLSSRPVGNNIASAQAI